MPQPPDPTHQWVHATPPADWNWATPDDTRRLWRAIMLAPTLEVCEALLRNQEVPPSALDPVWRKRFGL